MSESLIFIHADESCLGNQYRGRARPGGAAGLVEACTLDGAWARRDFWISEPDTTNNRMALTSAIVPLSALRRPTRVVFTSDSRYLVDGMTQWVHGWAARGWTRRGGEIENLALWKDLVATAALHEIEWRWVKGHAGHARNEYANFLATRAAAEQTSSGGLVASAYEEWLAEQQAVGRYRSESALAPHATFRPTRRPPRATV